MTCKFKDYKYERPNLDAVREKITALTAAMQTAKTFEETAVDPFGIGYGLITIAKQQR